jgi:DNA topoisomerase IB
MHDIANRVAARFKKKRVVDSEDGGKTTIYEYSDRQIARRNNEKAKRLEGLRGRIADLRKQVNKDLKSKDPETFLISLAVSLMDATAERIGNDASAKGDRSSDGKPHVGVTGWQKNHLSFQGKSKCTVKYTGKSGVNHVKEISDPTVVAALKRAHDTCKGPDIFEHAEGKVGAPQVNEFLAKFKITAKDIRGLHANSETSKALKDVRSKGGRLPKDKTKRDKQLKDELKQALEIAAEKIGHEAATLEKNYLIPGMTDAYLKDGTIMSTEVMSVISRYRGF